MFLRANVDWTPFQSAPPRGGRQDPASIVGFKIGFQSAPPRGGRHHPPGQWSAALSFQSAPPRGGRRGGGCFFRRSRRVSIRAPAWGATAMPMHQSDPGPVSIRAPAWGATPGFVFHFDFQFCFNPRPRVGGDVSTKPTNSGRNGFQSAPPRGGRQPYGVCANQRDVVSIRAPAWGATRHGLFLDAPLTFQSAPPRGGRLFDPGRGRGLDAVSIRAPAWGATTLFARHDES